MKSTRRKQRRDRLHPVDRLAVRLELPGIQIGRGDFAIVDVANRSEADQRHSNRSGQTTTIRRKSAIDKLLNRKAITRREAAICEWYAAQHEAGFEVGKGISANYGGSSGGGFGSSDLFARYKSQMVARQNYLTARAALTTGQAMVLERVILNGQTVTAGASGRIAVNVMHSFRRIIAKLEDAVGELVAEAR